MAEGTPIMGLKVPSSTGDSTAVHVESGLQGSGAPGNKSGNMIAGLYNNNNSSYSNSDSYNREYYSNSNPPRSIVGDGSTVDSALLAALRDSRERVALLRLEQVMVDFMNAPEGYLEVGGPYNAVVVSPNNSSRRFQNAGAVTDTGGRQTSFQRCILHRLADRFGIARETGSILEGSIRLIKQKDSSIPKFLLLDHVEENNNNNNNNNNSNTTTSSSGSNNNSGDKKSTAAGGGGTSAADKSLKPTAPSFTPPGKDKSKRKMKIMKRNSSAESSNAQNKSTPKSRKSKNFSDKERAYAEARARIFADEATNSADNSLAGMTGSQSAPASSAPSPSATPPPSMVYNNYNNDDTSTQAFKSAPVHKSHSNPSLSIPKRMSSSSLVGDNTDDNLPPAASSGVSKATWRNRREEENDPDFQRGAGLQVMMPPTAAAPPYMAAGNPYYYGGGAVATGTYPHPAYYGQQQDYINPGRGGVGGRIPASGRGFVTPRGYGYGQQPQQRQYPYNRSNTSGRGGDTTNVNCMDEFPALR